MLPDLISPETPFGYTDKENIISILSRMPEFYYIGRKELEAICELGPRIIKRGVTLVAQGTQGKRQLVIMLSGTCAVYKTIKVGSKKYDLQVSTVYGPSLFGEFSMFTHDPTIARVSSVQDVAVIIVSEEDLKRIFHAPKALKKVHWGFARLGLARCKSAARRCLGITPEIFSGLQLDRALMCDHITKFEDLISEGPESPFVNKELFSSISAKLEKLNTILALALHYKSMPEYTAPDRLSETCAEMQIVSPLVEQALYISSRSNLSLKESAVKALDIYWKLVSDMDELAALFKNIIVLAEQANSIYRADNTKTDDAMAS